MNKKNKCAWKSLEGCLCPEAEQQLQTAKEENENLKKLIRKLAIDKIEFDRLKRNETDKVDYSFGQIETLTQQYKQMMGALEKIDGDCHFTKECVFNHNCHKCHVAFYKNIAFEARQALKGGE